RKTEMNRDEKRKNNSRNDVVEMGDDVISVMNEDVDRRGRHKDTAQPADDEIRDEPQGKEHRRSQANGPTPESAEPVENLDGSRDGNYHRGNPKGRAKEQI